MDAKIKVLTEDTIGKIAAGEVVERPASVVKELVENSIDAGADSVEIEIQGAGQTLIRVADNGEGMAAEDSKLACYRHATSKISSPEDLDHITSLGFRGEALASIAAVSQVDIITRTASADEGTYVYIESAEVQRVRPAARDTGTTVEVRNLFYNVPARRKFLKKASTEMAEIINIAGRFILAYPGIEFKLVHGERLVLHAPGNSSVPDRIKRVLGDDFYRGMTEVSLSAGDLSVKGFASRPSFTLKDRRKQIFFLNGRFIRSRVLGDALQKAYESMLERGRYPAAVLFFEMPPEKADINVHPAKLQAKFQDEVSLRSMLESAVRSAFRQGSKESISCVGAPPQPGAAVPYLADTDDDLGSLAPEGSYDVQSEFGYSYEKEWSSAGSVPGKYFLQAGDCYIVRAGKEGIVLIDQHAAHERVLYEIFRRSLGESSPERQNLLFPVRVDLSAEDALLMDKLKKDLMKLGFEVEPFGGGSFVIQAVPAILADRDVKTVVLDILSDLSRAGIEKADLIDELIKVMSCRGAIKAGARLTPAETEELLDQLEKCELPFTCPHGRPTTIKITVEDLEKMFRRK
jgi:DNA mismatch repair protein MutL